MAEPRVFAADDVARKEFATGFRGFDQLEVRAYLGRLAAELAALHARERSLEDRLAAAEAKAVPLEIGEAELEAALGQQAAKVLHAARDAAAEIRGRAEEQVARLLREASADAGEMRESAAAILAERTAEAARAAVVVREQAAREVAARRGEADAASAATIEAAKEQGRRLVGEAQVVRERILQDLAHRRSVGQRQLEQLSAGRDRMLEACRRVQAALDAAVAELEVAQPEADAAAEVAGLRLAAQHEPGREEMEAEVVAAVAAGLVVSSRLGRARKAEGDAAPQPGEDAGVAAGAPAPEAEAEAEAEEASLRRRRRLTTPPAPVESNLDDDSIRVLPPATGDVSASPEVVARRGGHGDVAPGTDEQLVEAGSRAGPQDDLDGLFARLRADRDASVAHATAVLDASPDRGTGDEPGARGRAADAGSGLPTAFEQRNAAVEAHERALATALKRALSDEQNELLDGLRRARRPSAVGELLPPAEDQEQRYRTVAEGPLGGAFAAGTSAGGSSKGGAEDGSGVAEVVAALAHDLVSGVRGRLERGVADAGVEDEAATSKAVSAAYREWKSSRVEPLASHHVLAAHAAGAASIAKGGVRWVVDPEEGCTPDCADNALAGPLAAGEPFPTGHLRPPAHVGCRCLIVPATN